MAGEDLDSPCQTAAQASVRVWATGHSRCGAERGSELLAGGCTDVQLFPGHRSQVALVVGTVRANPRSRPLYSLVVSPLGGSLWFLFGFGLSSYKHQLLIYIFFQLVQ